MSMLKNLNWLVCFTQRILMAGRIPDGFSSDFLQRQDLDSSHNSAGGNIHVPPALLCDESKSCRCKKSKLKPSGMYIDDPHISKR